MQGLRVVFVAIDSLLNSQANYSKWQANKELVSTVRLLALKGYAIVGVFSPKMHGLLIEDEQEAECALAIVKGMLKEARCPAFSSYVILDAQHNADSLITLMIKQNISGPGSMMLATHEYAQLAQSLGVPHTAPTSMPVASRWQWGFGLGFVRRLQAAIYTVLM